MIIGIIGKEGSGKTLLLTYIGYLRKYEKKRKIIANYDVKFRDYTEQNLKMIVENFKKAGYDKFRYSLLLDEVYKYFMDSRRAMSDGNILTSYIYLQLRKWHIEFYWTAQDFMQVDTRLRQITNYYILPEFKHIENNVFLRIQRINPMTLQVISKGILPIPNKIFDMYDTYEFIKGGDLL
jgi:hypothetical protein